MSSLIPDECVNGESFLDLCQENLQTIKIEIGPSKAILRFIKIFAESVATKKAVTAEVTNSEQKSAPLKPNLKRQLYKFATSVDVHDLAKKSKQDCKASSSTSTAAENEKTANSTALTKINSY